MYFQSKLHNNSILTGSVDSYCLVCDSYLRSEDEAFTHTEKPIHKKNLGAVVRLEKFVDDHIIKVKKGYYCSFCNILLSTMTKVSLHISDMKHQENKGAQMLTRIGDYVIAFDDVAISWKSWHGIIENTCVICNTEFEKEDIHRINQTHILKLIQSKCEFGDKYVYRKVDEESFFCLICGSVFAISDRTDHHENIKHNILYNHGKELKKKTSSVQVKAKKIVISQLKPKTENGTKDTVTDLIKNRVAETDKNSNAASTEKKEPASANKTNKKVAESSKPVDSKETKTVDIDMTEVIDSKQTESVNKKNTVKIDTKNVKAEDTLDSVMESGNAISKVDDFIDSASKVINVENKDDNMSEYLNVNNYIVQGENCQTRCVLCDVIHIEDLKVHLSDDLHHQMMVKKHKEALYKKKNGPNAAINEIFPADNLVLYRGKLRLDNPENQANCGTPLLPMINTKPDQLNLKIAPPSDIQSKIRKQNPYSDISSDGEEEYKSKILEKVDKFQQNDITIDMSAEKANCKQCNEDVPFDTAALERHIDEQHKNVNKDSIFNKPEINMKTQIVTFARENYMVLMQSEIYCKLCKSALYSSMESMVQHVNLNSHKQKVLSKNGTGPVKKMQASDFIQTFFRVESNLGSDIILNNKHVLRHYSFHCVVLEGEIYKCMLCEIDFLYEGGEEIMQHFNTIEHKMKMGMCNVVSSLTEEFIREIAPGKYHCGYCNKIMNRWLAMQDHILHPSHLQARRHARWNLERCHTVIRNSRSMQLGSRAHSDYNQADVLRSPPPPPQADQPRPTFQYVVMLRELRASDRGTQFEPAEPERPTSQGLDLDLE